jgi:hypothetical protein
MVEWWLTGENRKNEKEILLQCQFALPNIKRCHPQLIKPRSPQKERETIVYLPELLHERSEDLADWTKHHIQETQGICPHVCAGPSDQSAQLGHLSRLDSRYHSRNNKTTTPSSVDWVENLFFLCWYHMEYFLSSVVIDDWWLVMMV